jgi:transposase
MLCKEVSWAVVWAREVMVVDTWVQRCAGLDVHKDSVVACVRMPGKGRTRHSETVTFATTTPALLALRDWLVAHEVTLVGMEATGVYWKPVFYVLEDAMECWLLNARHLRNVPGRKTDVADAEWIAQLVEHGLVRPSFVPPKPIRELRNLTRYRKAQIEERTREAQRLDKILQDAGIKLSSVASDPLGVSGRLMLEALVAGSRDPEMLAEFAKGALRKKLPALRDALTGRFSGHHALIVGEILAKLDYLDEAIDRLSAEITRVIAPFSHQVDLLTTIPGVNQRVAEAMIAEIGVDMARFGSAARLASWAGVCPGQHESAGKAKSGKTRKGSKWLQAHLDQAAKSAARTKGTYLRAQYYRLKGRRGHAKATVAVEHSILVAAFHILDRDVPYNDLGEDWFNRRHDPQRRARRLADQIRSLGYDVQLTPSAA